MIADWIVQTENNGFDPQTLGYPTVQYLCSYSTDGPVAYLPTQKVTMLESIAIKPGLDLLTSAQAVRDMVKGAQLEASGHGIKEIYFLSNVPSTVEFAKNNGFEEMPYKVLRMKL